MIDLLALLRDQAVNFCMNLTRQTSLSANEVVPFEICPNILLLHKAHLLSIITKHYLIIMSQTYVSLDWRRAPSASESIGRIQRFLTEADAKGGARVRGSDSRGQVSLVERAGLPPVLLRAETTSMRKGKGQALYWARMFSMALTISELLMDKQQVMARFVEYKEVSSITRQADI